MGRDETSRKDETSRELLWTGCSRIAVAASALSARSASVIIANSPGILETGISVPLPFLPKTIT